MRVTLTLTLSTFLSVSQVSAPWVYVGMLFASFCWHNEDNYLYRSAGDTQIGSEREKEKERPHTRSW